MTPFDLAKMTESGYYKRQRKQSRRGYLNRETYTGQHNRYCVIFVFEISARAMNILNKWRLCV